MPVAGPFYFAWVEPDETTFDDSHHRMDEYIFSAKRTIAEGEKPLLEIEIQNPHVGLLNPARKYWAWFSWFNGSSIEPLLFGRVVGVPSQMFEEVVTIQIVADPIDYKQRVQRVADTLKYRPFFDPVFIDVGQRDDPNTILEAHAKVWDVDAVTHEVTANDIITGSDGNEDFTEDDHFYDSMSMTISQPPATAILMDASVSWKQTARGTVDITNGWRTYNVLNGDGIISEWPQPLADIGGGYKVYFADAFDTAGANDATITAWSTSWKNQQKYHIVGDYLTVDVRWSSPMGGKIWKEKTLRWFSYGGVLDPYHQDEYGDPDPINRPPHYDEDNGYIIAWRVKAALTLKYDAERERTERAIFLIRADTQPVLTHPELDQASEVITRSGANVGVPIIDLLNWPTIAGQHVSIGQIIFPDNPSIPGGRSVQICTDEGTAGTEQPDFSDTPGDFTTDNDVVWKSMGAAEPPDNATDWYAASHINLGQMILPHRPFYVQYTTLLLPGTHTFPPSAVPIAEGTYVQMPDGSFAVCTLSGSVGPSGSSAVFVNLGSSLPSGKTYYICTQAGVSSATWLIPPFNETLHSVTTDNTVKWTCVGTGEIPGGGYPGDSWSPTYFATDRGRQSLEYLAAVVRAKLLWRARCIEIVFDADYLRGLSLTPRKTVTLHDPRIPGGIALGKIKNTELVVNDSGIANCRVTLACCAGLGDAVEEHPGTPAYVDDGYVNDGYQFYNNVTVVLPTTDLGYAPPVYTVTDDGITFPATREMIVVTDEFHMGRDVSDEALDSMSKAAQAARKRLEGSEVSQEGAYQRQREAAMLGANSLPALLAANPSWQEFQLRPMSAGPFHKVYNIKFTNLSIPMGVDLQSSAIT